MANCVVSLPQPALLQAFMRSSYHVASRSSVRNTSLELLVRRLCHTQLPLGRYSRTMAVMGQPPLLQPCRFSLACVELMWVKRCWSLLKEGSAGEELSGGWGGDPRVPRRGRDTTGQAHLCRGSWPR